jgi:hypothetical protein
MLNTRTDHRLLDRESFAAFAIYLGLSLFFFGRCLIGHFGDRYIGSGCDPVNQMYLTNWWIYAVAHHTNLFINRIAWHPEAMNFAKVPGMPSAALISLPITVLGGPVSSYNTLMLLSPTLSAWTAFILYRRLTRKRGPALCGGYLFGFSPFIAAHMLGQLHLVMGALMPLALYVFLLRFEGEITTLRFIVLMSLLLIVEFGFSPEFLALGSVSAGIALLLAWALGSSAIRSRLLPMAAPLALAYAIAALVVSPYLFYFFRGGPVDLNAALPIVNSATLPEFIIPTPVMALGSLGFAKLLVPHTQIYDTNAYIGIPALLVAALVAIKRGKRLAARLSLWMLLALSVLSLGPILFIGSHFAVPMPEFLIHRFVPTLKYAMPERFAAFFFLCIGALVAFFLSDDSWNAGIRVGIGALVVLSLLPNLNASFWTTPVDTPKFFQNGIYRKYISRNDVVLFLPYGLAGNSDLWQVSVKYYFKTAGSFLGLTPAVPKGYREWPVVTALYGLHTAPGIERQIAAFLLNKQVNAVIVPDGAHLWQWTFGDGPASWRLRAFDADEKAAIESFFGWLDPAPLHVAGVTIYRIPLDRLGAYARYTPAELQLDAVREQMRKLITAADSYLASGGDSAKLNLVEAANRGLIPRLWITGPYALALGVSPTFLNGLELRPMKNGSVQIGVMGSRAALATLSRNYAPYSRSAKIFGPLVGLNVADWSRSMLTLDFDREGLAKAAAYAARQEASAAANASEAREKGAFAGVHD